MHALDWKTLSSEYLYRDQWLTARRDRCVTPEGKIVDPYYVLEYPDWVNAVALTDAGQLLLIRQYRQAYGATILELPGGGMEPEDAGPEAAMRRELLEETGFAFDRFEYLGKVSPNPATSSNLTHMFLATGGKKVQEQQLDMNEEIIVEPVEREDIFRLLAGNQIVQSLHVSCLYYAFLRLGWLKPAG
ncbi:NUDIX hydrolase [Compostibacter hankyongensis]|uniref:NUDIX hydrolase n=2 Tax=Compostibacter hankyongensis TaxID=1007089 RepID=A0ABP8FPC5_9BACT